MKFFVVIKGRARMQSHFILYKFQVLFWITRPMNMGSDLVAIEVHRYTGLAVAQPHPQDASTCIESLQVQTPKIRAKSDFICSRSRVVVFYGLYGGL